mmetsp:Transcript_8793/g.20495  ORF Transcript_8793/g.20495 Transcript_8793/m.20495 type:complete len:403 (-) Transcript_8793:461-1669(-)
MAPPHALVLLMHAQKTGTAGGHEDAAEEDDSGGAGGGAAVSAAGSGYGTAAAAMVSDELAGEALVVWAAGRVGPGSLTIDDGWASGSGGGGARQKRKPSPAGASSEVATAEKEEAEALWSSRFAQEAVMSPEHDWRPFPHVEALLQILVNTMLGTPNPHRRLRLRMASERMFDSFDEASCQSLLAKLVKRCPHAQATGWLLDVTRRRISRAVNGFASLQQHADAHVQEDLRELPPPAAVPFLGDANLEAFITAPLRRMAADLNQVQLAQNLDAYLGALALLRFLLLSRRRFAGPPADIVCTSGKMEEWEKAVDAVIGSLNTQREFQPTKPPPPPGSSAMSGIEIEVSSVAPSGLPGGPGATGAADLPSVIPEPTPSQASFHLNLLLDAAQIAKELLVGGDSK